jgi:hypothetical protein
LEGKECWWANSLGIASQRGIVLDCALLLIVVRTRDAGP